MAEGLVGELGLVWTQQVSVWTGLGELAGHLRSMEEARPKETSRLSLHVQAWPAPLSHALPTNLARFSQVPWLGSRKE